MNLYFDDDGVAHEYNDEFDLTIHCETAEELEHVKKLLKNIPRWIPVSERMPEPEELVMVSFENFSLPMVGRYMVDDDDGGTFRVGDMDESFIEHDLYVNAWMPLPEPYREET